MASHTHRLHGEITVLAVYEQNGCKGIYLAHSSGKSTLKLLGLLQVLAVCVAKTITLFWVIKFFRGNPRLLLQALPVAIGMVVLKWLYDASSARQLELSPLLTGVIAAEVFIVGFMLSGTASDYEAERLPGELAGSLETVADECLIINAELKLPEVR